MGQNYKVVNITKGEFITPHTMIGFTILMSSGDGRGDLNSDSPVAGSWAGDLITIAGNYGDEGLFVPDDFAGNLYQYADENYRDISPMVWEALCIPILQGHSGNFVSPK